MTASLNMPCALRRLRRVDPKLGLLIGQHGPPTLRRSRNYFRSLGQAIVYQQLSGRAAGTIYKRFLALFPGNRFPTPAVLLNTPHDALRSVGLSNQKATYLHDLALKLTDGTVRTRKFNRMSDDEIGAALLQVKGIGQWSVDMFLMFAMNRPDVLPVGDLGIRKGIQKFFQLEALPEADEMLKLAEPWRPYRTVASWYMWRVVDTELPA